MKRYLTTLVIKKMKTKTTMRYHFTTTRMARFKKASPEMNEQTKYSVSIQWSCTWALKEMKYGHTLQHG